MKAKLIVNSAEVELGFKDLQWIAEFLEDLPKNTVVFNELAKSESYMVRMAIASKACINQDIFEKLIKDHSMDVLRVLSSNSNVSEFFDQESIKKLINTEDHEIQLHLADNLLNILIILDIEFLCEALIKGDVSVRYALAQNQATPTFFLNELLHDRDVNVAEKAEETLRFIKS